MHEHQLRQEMLRFGHLCYERHLLVALDGNLSTLLPSGDVLCTRAGCHKGLLCEDDLLVVNRAGKVLRGRGRPTSELKMHLACYDARPDIKAVIHAHPPLSVAFTVANVSMARCVLPEVVLTLGVVPTSEYATTGSAELAETVRRAIEGHDAILLDHHGAVCVGSSLLQAFCNLETMEHTALITKTARDLGGVQELPPDEAARLRTMGLTRYGGPPAATDQAHQPGADLPESCLACSGCADPLSPPAPQPAPLSMARVTTRPLRTVARVLDDGVEDAVVAEVLKALRP